MERTEKIKRTRQVAIIAAAFTALISLLMILNYLQISSNQPLESKALSMLVERLSNDPGNQELITEIRQLDLLARRAYFSSLWQINTGAWLLLAGAVVLVIALRSLAKQQFAIQPPDSRSASERTQRNLAQRGIVISAIAVFIMAGLSAWLSADHISRYEVNKAQLFTSAPDDEIERIEITTAPAVVVAEEPDIEEAEPEIIAVTAAPEAAPVAAAVVLTRSLVLQNSNAFRGAWGNGISASSNIPTDWNGRTGKNILWKTEVPLDGFNSPILWGDYLFLSGASASKRMVFCFDRHTGKILWEREVNNIPGSPATPPRTTDDTGLAAASLTTDGSAVFAIFGTGDIIAFDFAGNRLWARNLGVPRNHYGHSSSLLTWDNKVFVQYDTQAGCRVMALDTRTGQTVWETPRTNDISWASPILAEVNGALQLILLANPDLSGYDPLTGKQLWSVKGMGGEVGPSPAYGGGLVFAANEYATMMAVNPATGTKVWDDRYYLPEVSSPVYHDGQVYIATTFAVIAAFEAATGKFVWEYDGDDSFYSSPMIADGKLFVFDTEGKAYIFTPGKEPKLIATPELGEKVFASPAFASNRIYIRGIKHLYCIGSN
jgi:outer membrane protein assembly factor BamB